MKWVKRIMLLLLVLALVGAGTLFWVYKSLTYVPPRYEKLVRAQTAEPARAAEESDRMVRRSMDFINALNREGRWETVFTQDEINGWLAVDLPGKHADELPKGVSRPRVLIEPAGITIFAKVEANPIDIIVALQLSPELLSPNILRIVLADARAGSLGLPLSKVKEMLAEGLVDSEFDVTWQHVDGQPAALITWTGKSDDKKGRRRTLDRLALRDGRIYLSGTTKENSEP